MALEMKESCERCATPLQAGGAARICSFECTFCEPCGRQLDEVCPNCGGELMPRPRRKGDTVIVEKMRVGFIGLGIMGRPMAEHILRAGHELTVFNRTAAKTKELAAQGAAVEESPAGVAARSEVVITMVTDSPDVEKVIAGRGGVLETIEEGSIVIDMSTIAPNAERRLDALLRQRGCNLIDAPVSGGDVGAHNATLVIMAGGKREAFDRIRPLLEVMGKKVTYCGPSGSGQVAKLCNQILVSVTMLGVSEALVFARKSGLDPTLMIEAVKDGAAGSWQLSNLAPRVVERDFAPGFMIDLVQKDLRILLQSASAAGAPLPAASLVHQLFLAEQARGEGGAGTQALARVLERLARLE
jgi:3-hydroxyisobutyrate dehydrogenase